MTRGILLLILSVVLTGCSLLLPEQKEALLPPAVSEQESFDHYLELFLATGDPAGLDLYVAEHPGSSHRARAQALSLIAHELQQCRDEALSLVSASQSSLEKIDALEEKNRRLNETIEQLKSLLIQQEQRVQ